MLIEFQLVSGKRIISSIFSFFFLVFLTHGNMQRFFHLLITLLIRQQLARRTTATGALVRGTGNGGRRCKASPKPEADQEDVQSDTLTAQPK
jgi:hypothetical protein